MIVLNVTVPVKDIHLKEPGHFRDFLKAYSNGVAQNQIADAHLKTTAEVVSAPPIEIVTQQIPAHQM